MKRNLMIGVAAAAVIAGVLIAVLTSGGGSGGGAGSHAGKGTLASASSYLGLSPQQLRARTQSGQSLGQVAASTPGKSAAGLAEALVAEKVAAIKARHLPPATERAELARLRAHVRRLVRRARHRHTATMIESAHYLGLTRPQLEQQLTVRHSLAAVADATPGHSASGLIAAIIARRRHIIELAVQQHQLTRAQAQRTLAGLRRRVSAQVDRKQP